ncbi:MAG TPA: MFS transporter [Gammaproteobacteria bacterium]|nr:MFS transporter [Gammaproteobacteria bacterium]HIK71884.1 MFS transporter [Gammaproteobacteria bacterium]
MGRNLNAYRLLFFLTLLNLLNFVDRQLIASFSNFIVPDLGLTNAQFGFLTTLPFIVFYSVAGLFMGVLADMVNRPRLIAFGVVLWSIFTALTGAAKGFISMALPRMFIGVGESILTPTSMSLLSDSFPSKKMGFAAGFYYMGVPIGVGVSLLIAGYLGESLGWRNCFYLLGALGLVLGLCSLLFKDRPRKHIQNHNEKRTLSKKSVSEIIKTLFKALSASSALRFTILAGIFYHIALGASVFEQLWLVEERGFERSTIAMIVGWIGVFAGLAGNLIGGILSDWWQENTDQGRPMFLFWLALLTLPISIYYRFVEPGSIIFWIGIIIGYFQLGCFFGPTFSTVQELVPENIKATVVSFYILTLNLIGLTIGSLVGGILADLMEAANYQEPYTVMLVIFSIISIISIPCYYLAGKKYHEDKNRLETIFSENP